jgi:hypothetical protein
MEVHGAVNHQTTTNTTTDPTTTIPVGEEIRVEAIPIVVAENPPMTPVESQMRKILSSTPIVPRPSPIPLDIPRVLNHHTPITYDTIDVLPERTQFPITPPFHGRQADVRNQPHGNSGDTVLLRHRIPGMNYSNRMATSTMFPPSSVREEQLPVIRPSNRGEITVEPYFSNLNMYEGLL